MTTIDNENTDWKHEKHFSCHGTHNCDDGLQWPPSCQHSRQWSNFNHNGNVECEGAQSNVTRIHSKRLQNKKHFSLQCLDQRTMSNLRQRRKNNLLCDNDVHRFIDNPNHVNFKPTVRCEGSTLVSCSSHLLLLEDNDKTNTDTHFHDMPNSFQLSKNAVIASKTQSALITSRWNSSCPRWVWLEEMVGGNNANRRMQGTKELILCQCELHSFKIKWWQKHLTVKKESKSPNGLAELGCKCSVCVDMSSWDRWSLVFWIAIEVVIEQEQEKQMAQTVVTVKCLKPQGQAVCTLTSLLCRIWINSGID